MKLWAKSKPTLVLVALTFLALIWLADSRVYTPTQHSREAVLKTDLRIIRDAIDSYTLDKREPPHSLQDLVDAGYLRAIPVDPITNKQDWFLDFNGPVLADPVLSPDLEARRLVDVHSNSNQISRDGSKYTDW